MSTPIYYIKSGNLSFAEKTIFENIELYLYRGDKICLIGRNGCGKSSLMKVISGDYQLDSGDIYCNPTAKISYLKQDMKFDLSGNIYDFMLKDLNEEYKYKADIIFEKLKIDGTQLLSSLSGGQMRRVSLAKVLINEPEILLLDEPTNHLDIESIEWLESYIKEYSGTVVCISHDKAFLNNVCNKLWWIDREILRKSDKGFKYFPEWQEQIIQHEEAVLSKLHKKLIEENTWLSQGVTARRKRNQKRLGELRGLREELALKNQRFVNAKSRIGLTEMSDAKKTRFIIEAENISFSYNNKPIIQDFSFRVKKGEKIGIIGPNGSGKSTLIKLLIKQLASDLGSVKHGTELDITYFDQHRTYLNPQQTIQKTLCPNGGDQIFLTDRTQHVVSYLKTFLFDPKLLNAKVATLSGGEASRLLLAKTLINPGNLLILDEPTNDLDMDTLEMLVELLSDYTGTILIVSHDRDFLEQLVTRTLVFTEQGKIIDLIGGYNDYIKYYKESVKTPTKTKLKPPYVSDNQPKPEVKRLSYNEQRLLKTIPEDITALEKRIVDIEKELDDTNLYITNSTKFQKLIDELSENKNKIEELTNIWLTIES